MIAFPFVPQTRRDTQPARRPSRAVRLMTDPSPDVTGLLRSGACEAELLPVIYEELKVIARNRMSRERKDHTLQVTGLVHEAYMRLAKDEPVEWRERGHFYGAAAEAMRRILIDHARKAKSEKRGGGLPCVTLGAAENVMELDADHTLALEDALNTLEKEDPDAAKVTRLRFFSGLTVEQTAEVLGTSVRSVYREWSFARARLFELLGESED